MSKPTAFNPAPPAPTMGGPWRVAAGWLAATLADEQERWILWLPVGVGTGVGLYFILPAEPPFWLGGAVLAILLVAMWCLRGRSSLRVALIGVAALAAGFVAAQVRTVMVAAPVMERRVGPLTVEGRVVDVEPLAKGRRLLLDDLDLAAIPEDQRPRRVRIRTGAEPPVVPGNRIKVRAVLAPPAAPAVPGAFDFQRQSYFRGLGAVGFAMGRVEVTAAGQGDGAPALALAGLRQAVGERIAKGLGGPAGAMARALMTGERGAISPDVLDAMRDSGLAHLLAISGLHIGLVAGILFVGLRAALALMPPVALRFPIKKWAAVAALVGALAYALISGATVPTQRAFLMLGLVLLAVLVDRRGLGMRTVAWAALAILLAAPESLLGASFQLSFAAVIALIAAYEVLRDRRRLGDGLPRWGGRLLLYVGGVALSSLIAGAATAPFALYHFNRLAAFGLAANMAAVPLTALWIMPWAVIAFALMPLGLEHWALVPMGWGVDGVIAVAKAVAAWPGAVTLLPAMPDWGLAVLVFGGLWLCLWRTPWRLAGLAGIALGLGALGLATPPDVIVDDGGRLMAVRQSDGLLAVSSRRIGRFDAETWLRRAGQDEEAASWPADGVGGEGGLACDAQGCIYRVNGHTVALVRAPDALPEDCRAADVVVAAVPVRPRSRCPASLVIDRFDLWREGAHALWLRPDGAKVESVNGVRGRRPWVLRP